MVTIIIKNPSFYEKYKDDFSIIERFSDVVRLAVEKARRDGSPYEKAIADAEYYLEPEFYFDFGQDNPRINADMALDDGDYLDLIDNKFHFENYVSGLLTTIAARCDITVSIVGKSVVPLGDDWRSNSAYRFRGEIETVSQTDIENIWGHGASLHVFLSHKAEQKERAHKLKNALAKYGVSAFVAHDDIKPSEQWLETIEKALFSSDALIAMICKKFRDSHWTDQEVGIAIGRQIRVIPAKLDEEADPYGFIGKFQAFKSKTDTMQAMMRVFLSDEKSVVPAISSVLRALDECGYREIDELLSLLNEARTGSWTSRQKDALQEIIEARAEVAAHPIAQGLSAALGIAAKRVEEAVEDEIPF